MHDENILFYHNLKRTLMPPRFGCFFGLVDGSAKCYNYIKTAEKTAEFYFA
jgi:hypothetical protein